MYELWAQVETMMKLKIDIMKKFTNNRRIEMKKLLCSMLCLGVMFGCSNSDNKKETIQKDQETTEQKVVREYKEKLESHKNYKSGTYQVGKDFEAGEYCLFSNSADNINDSYEVRKNEFSDGDDTIYTDEYFLNSYVNLKKGEYIEIDNATLFSVSDMPDVHINVAYGMLKVGKDIDPGNYLIKPLKPEERVNDSDVYFEVLTPYGEYGDRNDIVMNELDFTTNKKIKLKKGQYLRIINCTYEKSK